MQMLKTCSTTFTTEQLVDRYFDTVFCSWNKNMSLTVLIIRCSVSSCDFTLESLWTDPLFSQIFTLETLIIHRHLPFNGKHSTCIDMLFVHQHVLLIVSCLCWCTYNISKVIDGCIYTPSSQMSHPFRVLHRIHFL